MEIEELQVGDKIELELVSVSEQLSFPSSIVEILSDDRIIISEISHNSKSVGFSDKDSVNFIHLGEKLHRWMNPSIRLVKYKKEVYHCVSLNGAGTLYNRRESFRLYLGIKCPLFIATSKGMERHDVLVKDISNGGIGFILSNDEFSLPLHKKVRVHLEDDSFNMNLHIEIIRTVVLEEKNATLYGCRYISPEILVGRYIMQKQGKKLKEMRS
ncbi:MAG: PilZ domain-containing protein [Velocimicrobium sp.]